MAGATATPGITTPEEMAAAAEELLRGGEAARQREPRRLAAASWREHAERQAARPSSRLPRWRPTAGADQRQVAERAGERHAALRGRGRTTRARPRSRRRVSSSRATRSLPDWLPAGARAAVPARAASRSSSSRCRGAPAARCCSTSPDRRRSLKRDQLVVMHDVTPARFPRTFSRRFVLWYSVLYRVLARRARHLATVSEFSRGELADVLGVDSGALRPRAERARARVRGARRRAPSSPSAPSWRRARADDYVLCVGNLTPSKNLGPVTRALAEAGIPVVVVGAAGARRVFARRVARSTPPASISPVGSATASSRCCCGTRAPSSSRRSTRASACRWSRRRRSAAR